jgi:uncharacterized membrane protein YuzA (DUF378 family)
MVKVINMSHVLQKGIRIMKNLGPLHAVVVALVVVGAVNWGLHAYDPSLNVVSMLLGQWPMAEKAAYYAVALSGLLLAYCTLSCRSSCKS